MKGFFFFFNGKDTGRKKDLFRYSVQVISEKELRRGQDKKEKKSQIPNVAIARWRQRKPGKQRESQEKIAYSAK